MTVICAACADLKITCFQSASAGRVRREVLAPTHMDGRTDRLPLKEPQTLHTIGMKQQQTSRAPTTLSARVWGGRGPREAVWVCPPPP